MSGSLLYLTLRRTPTLIFPNKRGFRSERTASVTWSNIGVREVGLAANCVTRRHKFKSKSSFANCEKGETQIPSCDRAPAGESRFSVMSPESVPENAARLRNC